MGKSYKTDATAIPDNLTEEERALFVLSDTLSKQWKHACTPLKKWGEKTTWLVVRNAMRYNARILLERLAFTMRSSKEKTDVGVLLTNFRFPAAEVHQLVREKAMSLWGTPTFVAGQLRDIPWSIVRSVLEKIDREGAEK